MPNFNKVVIMGHLTRDPKLSYTPAQVSIVDFGIAVNRMWKNKDGSDGKEVCYVDCICFGKSAESINKYLEKGMPLHIEGRLKFESWKATDGKQRSRLRVQVEHFQFIPRSTHKYDEVTADVVNQESNSD